MLYEGEKMINESIYGFPRPDFKRKKWKSLNGQWEFDFDWDESVRIEEGLNKSYEHEITVPFCYQSNRSGIGIQKDCPVVWYRKTFILEKENDTVLLKFGAVDYKAQIWVNGMFIGSHEGGYSSFEFDITEELICGENHIVVRVEDGNEADKPRGKQTWTGENFGCWYTPVTGIWQSVWLEFVPQVYLQRIKITPDLTSLSALCELFLSSRKKVECAIHSYMESNGQIIDFGRQYFYCDEGYGKAVIAFRDFDLRRDAIYWSPEHPNLISVDIELSTDTDKDQVSTYFGMRSISVQGNKILLNQEEYFQRLVLDQGYWEDTILTPPSQEAIIKDISLIKQMGFNGVRKHQKIEDPLFYYYADRMGLLVWGELPSSYEYNDNMICRSEEEMMRFLERDFNHPSIVVWVPVNESWGVRDILENVAQQNYTKGMLYLIKAMDKTRLVSANDGWEQVEGTDICTIHDYIYTQKSMGKYENMKEILNGSVETRMIFACNNRYQGQPIVLSEYGGIAFDDEQGGSWGYLEKVGSEEEFMARLAPVTAEIIHSRKFAGFCYTQLTDVMQEVNGLLKIDRTPKVSVERLKSVFGMKFYQYEE